MSSYSLKSQAAYLFIGRLIGFVVASVLPMILVRIMSERPFGQFREILFLDAMVVALMTLSVPQSLYYFFPRMRENASQLLSQTFTLLLLCAFAGTIIFTAWAYGSTWFNDKLGSSLLLPIAVLFLLQIAATPFDHLFILERKSRLVLAASAANELLRMFSMLAMYFWLGTVASLVYGMMIFQALRLIAITAYMSWNYRIGLNLRDRQLLREQWKFILPLSASGIVGLIGLQVDKAMITAWLSSEEFAIYSLGSLGILSGVTMLSIAVGNVSLPRLSELASHQDHEGMRTLWHKMILLNGVLLLPAVCFSFVFAREITIVLYTEQYVASADIFRINLFILPMMGLEYGRIPTAIGNTRSIFMANLARSIIALVLAFVLIFRIGMIGGAIAAVAALWVNGILQLQVTRNAIQTTVANLLPWRRLGILLFISSAMAAVVGMVTSPMIEQLHLIDRLQNWPLLHGTRLVRSAASLSSFLQLLLAGPLYLLAVGLIFRQLGYVQPGALRTILNRQVPPAPPAAKVTC